MRLVFDENLAHLAPRSPSPKRFPMGTVWAARFQSNIGCCSQTDGLLNENAIIDAK